jgi:hypothetical protein
MALSELPHDFSISDSMRAWAEIETPLVNIDREHKKFLNYWIAHRRRMHDWVRTWENWMMRCPQMGGALYTADEIRLKTLTADFVPRGFRAPLNYENSVIYQVQFDAWDLKRKQVPLRDVSFVGALVHGKRLT